MSDISINERFKEWVENEKISTQEIREITGISRSAVSQIMNNRYRISIDIIRSIAEKYMDLNIRWLITGNGSMRYTYEHFKESEYNSMKRLITELERLVEAKEELLEMYRKKESND